VKEITKKDYYMLSISNIEKCDKCDGKAICEVNFVTLLYFGKIFLYMKCKRDFLNNRDDRLIM
jgi:hypothetical protein